MDSLTYNNLGARYSREGNLFNGNLSFEMAISKDYDAISPLFNLSINYDSLGLMTLALKKINNAICFLENNRNKNKYEGCSYYSCRARLYRLTGKTDLMMKDIEKSFEYEKDYYHAWWQLAIHFIENCKYEEAFNAFTRAILNRPNVDLLRYRGEVYRLLNEYKKALKDFDLANTLSKIKSGSLYRLGYAHYLVGDENKANECYSLYKSKNPFAVPYNEADIDNGVVQFINIEKKFGFIYCSTQFNSYDSVYFKFADCKIIPQMGERVKFILKYSEFKTKLTAHAVDIEPVKCLTERFKTHQIYHAIIQTIPDTYKAFKGLETVELFYPFRALLPFNILSDSITEQVKDELIKYNNAFVELSLVLDPLCNPTFSNIKLIPSFNAYSNKKIDTYSKHIKSYKSYSDRYCPVCGLNEWCGTEGCPMDPT